MKLHYDMVCSRLLGHGMTIVGPDNEADDAIVVVFRRPDMTHDKPNYACVSLSGLEMLMNARPEQIEDLIDARVKAAVDTLEARETSPQMTDPITYYKQQTLQGGQVTGFRNEDHEPWIMYDTPPHSAVLKFKVGLGHYPLPDWKRRET